jgi:hypothetical protein
MLGATGVRIDFAQEERQRKSTLRCVRKGRRATTPASDRGPIEDDIKIEPLHIARADSYYFSADAYNIVSS